MLNNIEIMALFFIVKDGPQENRQELALQFAGGSGGPCPKFNSHDELHDYCA